MNTSRYQRGSLKLLLLSAVAALVVTYSTSLVAQESLYAFPSQSGDIASLALGGNHSLVSQMPLYSLPTASLHQMERYYGTYSIVGLHFGSKSKELAALHSFALGYRLRDGLDLSLGGRLQRGGKVALTDDLGRQAGSFRPTDATIDLAAAMSLSSHFDGYLRASYLMSSVGVTGHGVAVSLGASYHNAWALQNGLTLHSTFGASLDNLAPKLTYRRGGKVQGKVALPSELALHAQLHTTLAQEHTLGLALRGGYLYHLHPYYGMRGGVGAEYLWKDLLSLQLGVAIQGRIPQYSIGAGVHYKTFSLHTAYLHTPHSPSLSGLSLSFSHRL